MPTALFQDKFDTNESAPITTPRSSEPSGDQFAISQTNNHATISSSQLVLTCDNTDQSGDLGIISSGSYTQSLGIALFVNLTVTHPGNAVGDSSNPNLIIGGNLTGTIGYGGLRGNSMGMKYVSGTSYLCLYDPDYIDVGLVIAPTDYSVSATDVVKIAIVFGGFASDNESHFYTGQTAASYLYGFSVFVEINGSGTWTLLGKGRGRTGNIYPQLMCSRASGAGTQDMIISVDDWHLVNAPNTLIVPTVYVSATETNGTSLNGYTGEAGGAWTVLAGTWEILSNYFKCTADVGAGTAYRNVAYVASGKSDVYIETVFSHNSVAAGFSIVLRLNTADQTHLLLQCSDAASAFRLYSYSGGTSGTYTLIGSSVTINWTNSAEYYLRVRCEGTRVEAWVDHGSFMYHLDCTTSFNQAQTNHGVRCYTAGVHFKEWKLWPVGSDDEYTTSLDEYYALATATPVVDPVETVKTGHMSPVIIYGTPTRKITFPRNLNVYQPERISQINRQIAADGTPYTLKWYTKHDIAIEKMLVTPSLRRHLDDFQIFAEGGAEFKFAFEDRYGKYFDFEGVSNLSNDGDELTTTRTGTAYNINPINGLVESVAANTARFEDGKYGEHALLVERAGVNYCQQSADFSTTWSATNMTVTTNVSYLTDPAGGVTADKLAATANLGNVQYTTSQASTGVAVFSVWLKSLSGDIEGDLIVGDSATNNATDITITPEWTRKIGVLYHGSPSGNLYGTIRLDTSGDAVFAWGAQIESGILWPTTYMPSAGSNGTRGAEYHTLTLDTEDIGTVSGSLSFYVYPFFAYDDGLAHTMVEILNASNYALLRVIKTAGSALYAEADLADDSTVGATASVTADFLNQNAWNRIDVTWDYSSSNSIKIYHDSVLVVTSSNDAFAPPLTPNTLALGDRTTTGSVSMNGRLDDVMLWKEVVLTQQEINYFYNADQAMGIHRNRWDSVILDNISIEQRAGTPRYDAKILLREK